MTPQDFIAKWQRSQLSERSAAQQHFLDLCEVLSQPKPAEIDPTGEFYAFGKGVHKSPSPSAERGVGGEGTQTNRPSTSGRGVGGEGGHGWADVWWQHKFAWEYKGKHKDLTAAYQQLQQYREDLEN